MPDTNTLWKLGDEFLAYHPSASHVHPEFRDGWNACFAAARAHTSAEAAPRAWQVEALLDGKWVPQWPVNATREAAEKSMGFFEQTVEFRVVPLYAAPQPNAALADGWISVDEGLPETSRVVLACNDRGAMHHAQYFNGNWFHIWHPTHWREMPAPPTLNASKEAGNG